MLLDDLRTVSGTEELVQHIEDINFEAALAALVKIKNKWTR
jgi:hypothetical protein